MVAPITIKMIRELHVAEVAVWIPEGIWYDTQRKCLIISISLNCIYLHVQQLFYKKKGKRLKKSKW